MDFDTLLHNTNNTTNTTNEDIKTQYLEYLQSIHKPTEETWSRFSAIIPQQLKSASIAIIGVGGIGSALTMQLAKIGLKNLHVFDFDVVDAHNVGPQGFKWHQVSLLKVDAIANNVFEETGTTIFTYNQKIENYPNIFDAMGTPEVLIVAVDNMALRTTLASEFITPLTNDDLGRYDEPPTWYIDSRMSLGTWTIYSFPLRVLHTYLEYPIEVSEALQYFNKEGIFTDDRGVQEPCTAREINFTGEAISAKIVSSLLAHYKTPIKEETLPAFFTLTTKTPEHKWLHSFNTLTWNTITPTYKDIKHDELIQVQLDIIYTLLDHTLALHSSISTTANEPLDIQTLRYCMEQTGDPGTIVSIDILKDMIERLNAQVVPIVVPPPSIPSNLTEIEVEEQEPDSDIIARLMDAQPLPFGVGNSIKLLYNTQSTLSSWLLVDRITLTPDKTKLDKVYISNDQWYNFDNIKVQLVR